jgi:hypothetical protein
MNEPTPHARQLDGVDLRLGEEQVAVESAGVESLLAYLLLHRDAPQQRQHIAFPFVAGFDRVPGADEPAQCPPPPAPRAARA